MPTDESPSHEKGQPGIVQAALSGLCPRCKAPTLFDAPARVAFECRKCGLDFTQYERGARLAGLLTLLMAALLIGLAIGIDVALDPPLWLQLLVWGPLTVVVVIGTLRFYKTLLLYARYEKDTAR
ncbi:DUF983 domain-containing protein [Erythrobacter sp. GH1-10]|uniref:DUF983 domain-containing protein n=1 Tax=Erythrobacter sp. GH1-10 TaxID=3349334 RepID=UPI003877B4EA